ncbi:MAG: 6-phosphogluconolactonase [Chthoniobacteraceae bacterium]
MSTPRLVHTQDFIAEATQLILDSARAALAARGFFRIALSGGNTPRPVYAKVAELGCDLPWEKIQVTFGDERCVGPEDEKSNYRMAKLSLLGAVPIPEGNVFRMKGEIAPADAAAQYEHQLAAVAARMGEERYVHDLLLLGIGDDGHTASLFPGTTALHETTRNVIENHVPQLDTNRITFTYPLINAARHVVFLVGNPKKLPVVEGILAPDSPFPAAGVKPLNGDVTWLL